MAAKGPSAHYGSRAATAERAAKVRELADKKVGVASIAVRLGLSVRQVQGVLQKAKKAAS